MLGVILISQVFVFIEGDINIGFSESDIKNSLHQGSPLSDYVNSSDILLEYQLVRKVKLVSKTNTIIEEVK